MLAQLSTLKSRLAITVSDYDTILTNALTAISVRFDNECNRTFTRTASALHEFDSTDLEISVPCYPIESVTKFELKENETDGWTEQTDVEYLIRKIRFRDYGRNPLDWLLGKLFPAARSGVS